ncbi:MAG: hypothetical protein II933_03885 [Candidatus Methanomethylophilaceae archaeon]|nr:hypothetical protein [Candidatus Methanomethylophilaceae archaeon]
MDLQDLLDQGYTSEMDVDELELRIAERNEHPVIQYVKMFPFEDAYYNPDNVPISEIPEPLTWVAPGHDLQRPKRLRCGPVRIKGSTGEKGRLFVSCSNSRFHYLRGKNNHCWSPKCPVCLNDSCLRAGTRIEMRYVEYRLLCEKQGIEPGNVGHWIISPPQDQMRWIMQSHMWFNRFRRRLQQDLCKVGCLGGRFVFHPWRMKDCTWENGPHFHGVLIGFLDTAQFLDTHPEWVIKKVHSRDELQSIRLTFAYLTTHEGIGLYKRNPTSDDYTSKILNYYLPGLNSNDDTGQDASKRRMFRYTEEDQADEVLGKGRMVGEIGNFDWLGYAMEPQFSQISDNYFGVLANNMIKTVDRESYRVTRTCTQCGGTLNVYSGICDQCGEATSHIFENKVRAFARDAPHVKEVLPGLKDSLRIDGCTMGDLTPDVAMIVSDKEVMDNIASSRPKDAMAEYQRHVAARKIA